MGYLISKFSIGTDLLINGIELMGIGIAVWGIVAGGLHKFNMQPEVKSDVLITNGPFALIRNPMYLGILLFFGAAISQEPTMQNWLAYIILWITLLFKIRSEEHFLLLKFGEPYRAYKKRTFRLIPYIF
jgi:protein-S-isoprenylcysteine O-methyltransferase Ste14